MRATSLYTSLYYMMGRSNPYKLILLVGVVASGSLILWVGNIARFVWV